MPFSVGDWRGLDAFRAPTEAQVKKRQYKQHEQLGQGGFGRVLRAEWRNPDEPGEKRDVALKIIDKARVNEALPVEAEIEVLQKLRHEHIVRLYDSFETKHSFYLAFELATGGELFERIRKGRYPEVQAAGCIRQILSGIAYLHANRIVHRDIKPENIMYRTRDPASPLVIVDFGIAKFIDNLTDADGAEGDEGENDGDARGVGSGMSAGIGAGAGANTRSTPVFGAEEAASNMAGTFGYASPEALKGRRPACKMDMWSIGIISYQILGGYRPFRGRSKEEMIRVTLRGKVQFNEQYWSGISDAAKDFVKALLVVDPEQRMSAEDALRHPWLTSMAPAPASTLSSRADSVDPASSTSTTSSSDSPTRLHPNSSAIASSSAHPAVRAPSQPQLQPQPQPQANPPAPASLPDTPESDRESLLDEEDAGSDDEGFFTPDEGDDHEDDASPAGTTQHTVGRAKSRKSLRSRQKQAGARIEEQDGQVPDIKRTLAVDTAVAATTATATAPAAATAPLSANGTASSNISPASNTNSPAREQGRPAWLQVKRGASGRSERSGASASASAGASSGASAGREASPTDKTSARPGLGLKGMMGKLGLGTGSVR